jgi:DsbC/DsbD-like thiol-disulfide interchange protein
MRNSATDRVIVSLSVCWVGIAAFGMSAGSAVAGDTSVPPAASDWSQEQGARVRVIAASVVPNGEASRRIYAGVEIDLDDGWKTYWRNPGSSGVPPRIEFDGSGNLAKAELMFPAPVRFKDRDGDTVGYKKHVVLPVALTPSDPSKPISLKVSAEFGICREICVPVQPVLSLIVPPEVAKASDEGLLPTALARVPLPSASAESAPRLETVSVTLAGAKPQVVIDARFPGRSAEGDIFLEAPDGIWIPLPQPSGAGSNGARRFVVDLDDGADLKDLQGRRIRVTLVGSDGQSETSFKMVEAK